MKTKKRWFAMLLCAILLCMPAQASGAEGSITDPDMTVSLERCCAVAGLSKDRDGSFDYYMREPARDNDAKGVGPYMMLDLMMEEQ